MVSPYVFLAGWGVVGEQAAQETNRQLLAVVEDSGNCSGTSGASGGREAAPQLKVADVLLVVASQLGSRAEATRLAALAW